jgi:hypothetical protein
MAAEGWRVIKRWIGMVLDGSKEASRRYNPCFSGMSTMVFQEEVGLVTKELYLHKRAMEADFIKGHHPYCCR